MKGAACTIPLLASVLRRTQALVTFRQTAWNPRTILSTSALFMAACSSGLLAAIAILCTDAQRRCHLQSLWSVRQPL